MWNTSKIMHLKLSPLIPVKAHNLLYKKYYQDIFPHKL